MKRSLSLMFLSFPFVLQAETVFLKVTNLQAGLGLLAVAIHDQPDSFPDRANHAVLTQFYPLASNSSELTVKMELKPGRYALATFQDENKNKKLDSNVLGVPKERFGFSNNPKILFSAPNFSECEFEVVEGKQNRLSVRLSKIL